MGWLYVAEGSNLGAAFLLKEAVKLNLSGSFGARHLAGAPEGRGLHWRTFTAALDSSQQQEMSDQSTPNDAKEEPVEEEPPQPEVEAAKSEPLPDPPPEPVEREVDTETPALPEIADAEAVLDAPAPPPPPELVEEKPEEEEKKPEPKKKPKPKRSSVAKSASAPKPVQAKRAKTNAAPTAGVGATMSISTWRGSVMAHLNRHKRYPGSGGGTASVAFTIDRSGRVLSARLIRSSGSSILDQEAVALARRASPLPAPPPNIGGGSVVLTVPVRFSR
jgi:protein TonB